MGVNIILEGGANPNLQVKIAFFFTAKNTSSEYQERVFFVCARTNALLGAFCGQKSSVPKAKLGHCTIAELFEVLLQDNEGNSPVHLASTEGFDRVIETLLEYNANPDLPNVFGKTALH